MLISVIIPCRNEKEYISNCIKSVQKFILPDKCEIEMLLVDGRSTDNTREIISNCSEDDNRIRLLDNPGIYQVCALNIGIMEAKGEYILRLDAHAIYPNNYLFNNFNTLNNSNADISGGLFITFPGGKGYGAQLVQALTTHKFGVGNSGFRTGASEGEVDTVAYGFFRKSLIKKVGLYNELLVSGEDYEFNCRVRKSGGKIWLNPEIQVNYFNQPTLLEFYKKQFKREGHYNAYMWYVAPYSFAYRHAIPGVFTSGIIVGAILASFLKPILYIYIAVLIIYGVIAILSSFQQALRYKKPSFIITLPLCFFGFHFFYGLGIISGVLKLMLGISPVQRGKGVV